MNRVKKQRKGRKADRAPALEPDRPDAGRFSGYMAGIFDISSLVLGTISAVSPYLVWWAISPGNNRGPGAAISQKHRRVLAPYLRTFSRRRWGRDWPADDRLVETLYPLGDQLLLATEGQAGEAALMTLWEWGLNSFAEEDAHLQAETYPTIERLYDRVARQGLSPDGAAGERFAALRELYDGFIAVTIGEHFVVAERRFLEGAMKALVVLRALGLGYVGAGARTPAGNQGRTRAQSREYACWNVCGRSAVDVSSIAGKAREGVPTWWKGARKILPPGWSPGRWKAWPALTCCVPRRMLSGAA
jgi:hypothetical protein